MNPALPLPLALIREGEEEEEAVEFLEKTLALNSFVDA
jgi:hypothetical protein